MITITESDLEPPGETGDDGPTSPASYPPPPPTAEYVYELGDPYTPTPTDNTVNLEMIAITESDLEPPGDPSPRVSPPPSRLPPVK